MSLRFERTEIPGVIVVEPRVHRDERGFFLETYHAAKYREGGIDAAFVQDNHSRSGRDTLRGLHAQHPRAQGKLVRALQGEMTDHLGYAPHAPEGRNTGNSRNGTTEKTVQTESGSIDIEVPRDRAGTFEPQLVKKRQRRLEGFDEKVLALYARGMTTREIQAQVTALRSAVLALEPPVEFGRPAHRLYRELVAPALAAARAAGEPIRELVVVPDGALHLIPFEALITTAPRAGDRFEDLGYLVRDLAISYAPSATVLASLESGVTRPVGETETRSEPPLQFLAFADPRYDRPLALNCPELNRGSAGGSPSDSAVRAEPLGRLAGSRAEVQSIERLYAHRGRVYLGSEASEERIKSDPAVAAAERVHLAVHGVVCESFPERSGLVFALAGGLEDGILQTREIFGLRLAADLVVLSACETGVGRLVSGEGVVGLTRAFFYAGAPSLVVSLWQVSDRSTARLMTSFYEHLDRGEDKAVALQRSRLALIEAGGPGAAPFYWAPFVVQGSRGVSAGR